MKRFFVLFILIFSFKYGYAQNPQFPYSPPAWRTPICFPNDWQKSLVDERGDLNYDFGPGPYAKPITEISVGIKDVELEVVSQRLYNPRVPIVITELMGNKIRVHQKAFALVDSLAISPHIIRNESYAVKRYNGFVGAVDWAQPKGNADAAFRNVAWGTNRPIRYSIGVDKNGKKKVALGFCDSYRVKGKIPRVMELNVEGAKTKKIDLLVLGEQNEPQTFIFDAKDQNGDSQIDIEVAAAREATDPNVLMNVIWVFPENYDISIPELIAGKLTKDAEIYVDCGQEQQLEQLPLRRDGLIVEFEGSDFTPIIHIKTNRNLKIDKKTGHVYYHQQPFFAFKPKPIQFNKTEKGYVLEFPPNNRNVEMVAYHGYKIPKINNSFPDLNFEMQKTVNYWEQDAPFPWEKIKVPDERIQALFESSVRVLYQIRDYVDGYPQFQPGPTVYRGFWASDGMWEADAALLIGDFVAANLIADRFIDHQKENGRIEIMTPSLLHRETSHFLWLLYRYPTLTQDKNWLGQRWEYVEKAVSHLQDLRKIASVDPNAPHFGLIPPGLTDGGIGGVDPEYGSVHWSLVGLKSAIRAAELLNKDEQAQEWQKEFDDFMAEFRKASERDMRKDKNGNIFLPMKMAFQGEIEHPQRGQSQLCHTVFPGKIFGLKDPFVKGLFDIYDENKIQGLVLDTGWLKGGVWPFQASHRAHAELWVGRVEKAWDALFAFADHATPTLVWVEEQMPDGKGSRTGGDCPQTNSNGQIIRLLRHLLVLERDDNLHLLDGLPGNWIYPGAELILNDLPTEFGTLNLSLKISNDGKSGRLDIDPIGNQQNDGGLNISLKTIKEKGFRLKSGKEITDVYRINWGEEVQLDFVRVK